MTYPGNASLAQDIQDRILETFQQTLKLVEDESLNEAKLGCDFILRLDPMFEPARWLQDRLESSDGPIVLDDLKQAIGEAQPAEEDAASDEAASEETAPEKAAPEPDADQTATAAEAGAEATVEAPAAAEPEAQVETPVEAAAELEAETATEPEPEPEAQVETAAEPEAEPQLETAPEAEVDLPDLLGDDASDEAPEAELADDAEIERLGEDEPPAVTQRDAFGDEGEPTPATEEEVAAAPVAALDTESEKRIQDLLAEGQGAFERGEYQTAIDAWSRIFLIDIDHPEASERIEAARKLKAEAERTVEEAFHEALAHIERGAAAEGRAGLEKVLEMQPDHLAAREQLEKLDSAPAGEPVAPAPTPTPPAEESAEPAEPDSALTDIDDHLELDGSAPAAEVGAQVEPIPVPKPKKQGKKAAEPADKKKLLLYVGAGLLVLVLVVSGFVISNWSNIFPNTTEPVEAESGERLNPIQRAEELHVAGQTSTAIAQLKRLPPHHELYSEAQALVAQWEAAAAAESQEVEPTEADLEEFELLLTQAGSAGERGEFLRVDELLSRAAAIRPLEGEAAELKLTADRELEPIRSQVAIFKQGEWEMVLRDLWRLREDAPDNADINRLIVDSYYNLGVRALQRGDTTSAAGHFNEALSLAGSDTDLLRASRFAQTYQDRPEDLLYRIYVKYLPFR